MLKKYKITYLKSDRANAKRYTEEIIASSKYNGIGRAINTRRIQNERFNLS